MLKTLRYKLFVKADYITKDGNKKIINLTVTCGHTSGLKGYGTSLKHAHSL